MVLKCIGQVDIPTPKIVEAVWCEGANGAND